MKHININEKESIKHLTRSRARNLLTPTRSLGELETTGLRLSPVVSHPLDNTNYESEIEDDAFQPVNRATGIDKENEMASKESQEIQAMVEKRIPLFYGQPDIEISEVHFFLDAINRLKKKISEAQPRNEDRLAMLLEELIERLRGRAYDTIREQTIKSVDDLYKIIAKNFLPTYSIEQLSNRLHSAKQQHNESCLDFGKRVRSYASDYETGIKCKYGEDNTIPRPLLESMEQEVFIKGIENLTIRSHLLMTSNTSMNELMQTASRLESCFSAQRGWSSSEPQTKIACQLCDRMGHNAKECTKSRAKEEESNQYRGTRNAPPEIPTCFFCKRKGHIISECRTRRRAMENQYAPQNRYNRQDEARQAPIRPSEPATRYQYYNRPDPSANEQRYSNHIEQNKSNNGINHDNRIYNNQPPRYQRRNQDNYVNYNSRFNKQNVFSPPRQRNQVRSGQHDDTEGINEGMRSLAINYIDKLETESNMDQGNDHGLVDISQ